MKRIGVGIIGCGIVARRRHVPALKALSRHFNVRAVCDILPDRARQVAISFQGAQYCFDYHNLLSRGDIDAVVLALPIQLHYEVSQHALEAGKHVLVEKPIAGTLNQARHMASRGGGPGLVLMVAENYRFRPLYHRVRKIIDTGEIGVPYEASWDVSHRMDMRSPYVRTPWRFEPGYEGGFLADRVVHYVAALRVMLGEPSLLDGNVRSINPMLGPLDTLAIRFSCPNDVQGALNVRLSAFGLSRNELRIFGDGGTLRIVQAGAKARVTLHSPKGTKLVVGDDDGGYLEQLRAFWRAVVTHSPDRESSVEAFRDLEFVLSSLGHQPATGADVDAHRLVQGLRRHD